MIDAIRIGQWNILNKGNFKHRYERILKHPQVQELDILVLQEVVNFELLKELAINNNFPYAVFNDKTFEANDSNSKLAVLSKTPLNSLELNQYSYVFGCKTFIRGKDWNIFSAHLAHGGDKEHLRFKQAAVIDNLAMSAERDTPGSVSVLCGDLNTNENSRTIRFLKGLDFSSNGTHSTYWVDAWDLYGTRDEWATNTPATNSLAHETAINVGIKFPHLIPPRRIDYIMVRGWIYGKTGCPISFSPIIDSIKEPFSDHQGIISQLLIT